jgi:hypothetical protein
MGGLLPTKSLKSRGSTFLIKWSAKEQTLNKKNMKKFFVTALLTISGFSVSTLSLATSNDNAAEDISGSYCYYLDELTSRLELYSDGECAYLLTGTPKRKSLTGTWTFNGREVRIVWRSTNISHGTYTAGIKSRTTGRYTKQPTIKIEGFTHTKGCK